MDLDEDILLYQPTDNSIKTAILYLQLIGIEHLPAVRGRLFLSLKHATREIHKHNIYPEESEIDLRRVYRKEIKPTFSIIIEVDDIDEINNFSDNPLSLVMYHTALKQNSNSSEHLYSDKSSYEYEDEASMELSEEQEDTTAIAQGYIDLLKFFTKTRPQAQVVSYLYPFVYNEAATDARICKTTWQVSGLSPLLKELTIANTIFITLESIYNASDELKVLSDKLELRLTLQANKRNKYKNNMQTLCSFKIFTTQIIVDQNVKLYWESLKNANLHNINSLGICIDSKFDTQGQFKNLLWDENTDFKSAGIDINEALALVCNSVHRYVLTSDIVKILEQALNEYQVHVHIYSSDDPTNILLLGMFDPTVLLYPHVNTCRFSVKMQLRRFIKRRSTRNSLASIRSSRNTAGSLRATRLTLASTTFSNPSLRPLSKPIFVVIAFAAVAPLTELSDEIVAENARLLMENKLTPANIINIDAIEEPAEIEISMSMLYKGFDTLIINLIEYMLQHPEQYTDDKCYKSKKLDKIMQSIIYGLNKRFPAKNYIELSELVTRIYNELEPRVCNIVQNYLEKNLNRQIYSTACENQAKIIELMNYVKYMYEAGNEKLGQQIFNKLKYDFGDNVAYKFYVYLYDVEKQNYEAAKIYQAIPIEDKLFGTIYFESLINIYINYMTTLKAEETYKQATEQLLNELRTFAAKHRQDITVWILLHCVYRNCHYTAGINYTRWKYQNLYDTIYLPLPNMPISRWKIINNYELTLKTTKAKHFYKAMQLFLHLGLYKFAEMIYNNIAEQPNDIEHYLTAATLKMFAHPKQQFELKHFNSSNTNPYTEAFVLQINGCLQDQQQNLDEAKTFYAQVLDVADLTNYEDLQLSVLRYAFRAYDKEHFQMALKALRKCAHVKQNIFIINYYIGKTLYKLDRLPEALEFFIKSSESRIHIPDIWAYLAIVNLKLKENFRALECWRYANIKSCLHISEDIYAEIEKINIMDISLFVDKP